LALTQLVHAMVVFLRDLRRPAVRLVIDADRLDRWLDEWEDSEGTQFSRLSRSLLYVLPLLLRDMALPNVELVLIEYSLAASALLTFSLALRCLRVL